MKLLKRISYKILIVLMIIVNLSFFSASSVVQAKLTLQDGQFYYTGTQEAQYVVKSGVWSKILHALGEIASLLLGFTLLAMRSPIVGWFEIMEMMLSVIVEMPENPAVYVSDLMVGWDSYSQDVVNVERIIFNKVPLLNANIFSTTSAVSVDKTGNETNLGSKNANEVATIVKNNVTRWYYILRLAVIAFMLLMLIFVGIKMAITTVASEKAVYKRMLIDWVVGFIIVFTIHYIMILIFTINDGIVEALDPAIHTSDIIEPDEYEYGTEEHKKVMTSSLIETTLYETARTRAFSTKIVDGFTGMVIYGVLIYYAWKFALIYFRRLLNIIVLTLFAPIVAGSYAFNKVLTGKSKVFSTWLNEYIMNVIIQIFHVVIYASFVSIALEISLISLSGVILVFVVLNFMDKAEKLLRQLFKVSGGKGSLVGDMADRTSFQGMRKEMKEMRNAMVGGTVTKAAMNLTYGAIKKPIEAGTARAVAKIAAETYDKRKEKEQEREEKAAQKYLDSDEEARRLSEEIFKNEARRNELEEKLDLSDAEKAELAKYKKQQDELEEKYLQYKLNEDVSLVREFRRNLYQAMDSLVEEQQNPDGTGTGKYKIKKVTTKRKGGLNKAFWRKKTDSLTLRFKNNMKLTKLLGVNSAQEKVLKSEMDYWKKRITGFATTAIGFPALALNPLVGMAALTNSAVTGIEASKRRRLYRLRLNNLRLSPSNSNAHKIYKFTAFGGKAVERLGLAERYHMLEAEKLDTIQQKLTRKELKRVKQSISADKKREQIINDRTKREKQAYKQIVYSVKEQKINESEQKTVQELTFEEFLHQRNVVGVGNSTAMEIRTGNTTLQNFISNIRDIRSNYGQMRADLLEEKINSEFDEEQKDVRPILANARVNTNSRLLITKAIVDLCKQNNITIEDFELTDESKQQIQEKLRNLLNAQGAENIDELIKLDDRFLSLLIHDLRRNREDINQFITGENAELEESTNELLENIREITSMTDTDFVIEEMNNSKELLIREAIFDLCMQRNIIDIEQVALSETAMMQINQNIFNILEQEAGVALKEEVSINEATIAKVVSDLSKEKEETNDELKDRLIETTILEYIARKQISDTEKLRSKDSQEEIYKILEGKLVSDASKKSAEVIRLFGKKENAEEIGLSDEDELIMRERIRHESRHVKKVELGNIAVDDSDSERAKKLKQELVDRAVSRDMSRMQDRIEQAVYLEIMEEVNSYGYGELSKKDKKDIVDRLNIEDDDKISETEKKKKEEKAIYSELKTSRQEEIREDLSEEELEMYQLLVNIINENRRKEELGIKPKKKKTKTKEKMMYFEEHDGSRRVDETKDGSRRFDDKKDGSKKLEEADTLLYGEAADVIELIRKIRV